MGFFTKDIKTLNDIFVHTLRDIYYAKQQIATPARHGREASGQSLRSGFETHLAKTKNLITPLEKVFENGAGVPKTTRCAANPPGADAGHPPQRGGEAGVISDRARQRSSRLG